MSELSFSNVMRIGRALDIVIYNKNIYVEKEMLKLF